MVSEAPLVTTTTTTSGTSVNRDILANVPVSRNFTEVVQHAVGTTDAGNLGKNNPSVGGSSGLENMYFVDGVNITNAGFGGVGTFSREFGSLGTALSFDFLEEVVVKTGGYEAEFGQAAGGVVNAVTKSGTNSVRGSVFGFLQPGSLQGEREQPNRELTAPTVEEVESRQVDIGFAVGGPIKKDKAFWFAAINPIYPTRYRVAPTDFVSLGEGGLIPAGFLPPLRHG